jgi:hypothetical protein
MELVFTGASHCLLFESNYFIPPAPILFLQGQLIITLPSTPTSTQFSFVFALALTKLACTTFRNIRCFGGGGG